MSSNEKNYEGCFDEDLGLDDDDSESDTGKDWYKLNMHWYHNGNNYYHDKDEW